MPSLTYKTSNSMLLECDPSELRPVKLLGCGDMGTVVLAVLKRTGEPFAVKVMDKKIVKARNSEYRAQRELEILSGLDHPFLPKLSARFESKKHIYLVMNYCPGGDMNVLRRCQPEKRFSENAIRFYAAELVLALEYLHKNGIVYRDLKPENVLIQESGHIMLTDFDLSIKLEKPASIKQDTKMAAAPKLLQPRQQQRPREQQRHHRRRPLLCGGPMDVVVCASQRAVGVKEQQQYSRSKTKKIFPSEMKGKRTSQQEQGPTGYGGPARLGSIVGTEEYVAPEMVLGTGHGMSLDWWTLGILMYEMLYGTTPFKGKSRKDTFINIVRDEPHFSGPKTDAVDLISKLLAKNPSKRLGFERDAEEIKLHPFFEGVDWEYIELVSRPPFVPPPLVVNEDSREVSFDYLLRRARPLFPVADSDDEDDEEDERQDGVAEEKVRGRDSSSSSCSSNYPDSTWIGEF